MKTPIQKIRCLILKLKIDDNTLFDALDNADEQFEEAIIQAHTHMRCVDRQHESYECTLEALDNARNYFKKTYTKIYQ